MDYDQLREILVNTESLYSIWQSSGLDEEVFIRANASFIEEAEKSRLAKERERARQRRFFNKQKAQGRKSLTALVSSETYDELCRRRDKSIQSGESKSLGQVLDDIVLPGENEQIAREFEVLKEVEERRAKANSLANLKQNAEVENFPPRGDTGKSRDIAAKKTNSGMSGKSLETSLNPSIEFMKSLRAQKVGWREIVEELNRQGLKPERADTWTESNARAAWCKYNK